MPTVGEKIKILRQSNKLTQKELADILFVSEKTISSWENDRTIPEISMIYKISNKLKTSFLYLINDNYNDDINEVSFKVKLNQIEYDKLLNELNSKKMNKQLFHQKDIYYVPIKYDFNDEWLRIRNDNGKYILNYKKRKDESFFDKYDVHFDNINNLKTILKSLGFTQKGVIEKERLELDEDSFKISLDNVKDIGLFAEFKLLNNKEEYSINYLKFLELLDKLNIDLNLIVQKKYFDYL